MKRRIDVLNRTHGLRGNGVKDGIETKKREIILTSTGFAYVIQKVENGRH